MHAATQEIVCRTTARTSGRSVRMQRFTTEMLGVACMYLRHMLCICIHIQHFQAFSHQTYIDCNRLQNHLQVVIFVFFVTFCKCFLFVYKLT